MGYASKDGGNADRRRTGVYARRRIMPEINPQAASFPAQKICRTVWTYRWGARRRKSQFQNGRFQNGSCPVSKGRNRRLPADKRWKYQCQPGHADKGCLSRRSDTDVAKKRYTAPGHCAVVCHSYLADIPCPYYSALIGLISSKHSMVCIHFLKKGIHTKASSTRCRNLSGTACFLCAVSFIPILVCLFRRFRRRGGRGELLRQLFE